MTTNDNQKKQTVMRWPRVGTCSFHADRRGYTMHSDIWPPAKPGRTYKAVVRRPRPTTRRKALG